MSGQGSWRGCAPRDQHCKSRHTRETNSLSAQLTLGCMAKTLGPCHYCACFGLVTRHTHRCVPCSWLGGASRAPRSLFLSCVSCALLFVRSFVRVANVSRALSVMVRTCPVAHFPKRFVLIMVGGISRQALHSCIMFMDCSRLTQAA